MSKNYHFTILTPQDRGKQNKILNWINSILKLKYKDYLIDNQIKFTLSSSDDYYYNQMLKEHDFQTIDYLKKSPKELLLIKEVHEEVVGETKL